MPTDVCDLITIWHPFRLTTIWVFSSFLFFFFFGKLKLILTQTIDWSTLFFQNTQGLSALDAALRCLPMVFVGIITNIATGLLVDKVSAGVLVSLGGLLSAGKRRPRLL